jgi:hypothetical protein
MQTQILAVIHSRPKDALENAVTAMNCGCDGVFFISHGDMTPAELLYLSDSGVFSRPQGVNLLGFPVIDAMNMAGSRASMVWSDYTPSGREREVLEAERHDMSFNGLFFGGVAFKYQPQPLDLRQAAEEVRGFVDVLTTSGDGTGYAPEVEKLAVLAEGFGNKIAVASGVTPENVVPMLPYLSHILVSTGISKDFYTIDPDKCKRLVDVVKSSS